MKHKVEGHHNIFKDTDTGVIVNREYSERSKYQRAKHQSLMNQQNKHDISRLSKEVSEIKSLLHQLLAK